LPIHELLELEIVRAERAPQAHYYARVGIDTEVERATFEALLTKTRVFKPTVKISKDLVMLIEGRLLALGRHVYDRVLAIGVLLNLRSHEEWSWLPKTLDLEEASRHLWQLDRYLFFQRKDVKLQLDNVELAKHAEHLVKQIIVLGMGCLR
jgi:hypothetical protein